MSTKLNTQYLGITMDQLSGVDIGNAEVYSRRLLSYVKDMAVTIRPDGISFNQTCINALEEVVYVQLLVDWNKQMFYLVPSRQYAMDSQRWCTVKNGKRKTRKISGVDGPHRLYKRLGWNKGYYYRILGAPAYRIDKPDEIVLAFELKMYDKVPLTAKGRESAGVTDEEVGNELDSINQQLQEAEAERAKAKEERKKRPKKKKEKITGLEDDAVGIPFKDHVDQLMAPTAEMQAQMLLDSLFTDNGKVGEQE